MSSSFSLHLTNPDTAHGHGYGFLSKCIPEPNTAVPSLRRRRIILNPLNRRRNFATFSLQSDVKIPSSSEPSVSSNLTSTVRSSAAAAAFHQPFTASHIRILSFFACAAAISATWLFCSAIPALLAFKKAADSLTKLMDVTREELPDTMAAVRLSGMEISDLTMELSDLGQEITQGVRSSTRAVRLAEERLRRLTNMTPTVSVQKAAPTETAIAGPVVARSARGIREGIVKGRAMLQMFFTVTRYSKMFLSYLRSRAKT